MTISVSVSHYDLELPTGGVIGHRGAAAVCPENTLISMQTARDTLNWIECDVQLTADGQLVIFHDDTIERTSNGGKLTIRDNTLAILQQYDYGSWFDGEKFKNTPLLTLQTLWDYANFSGLHLNLEIKPYGNGPALISAFIDFIQQHPIRKFDLLVSSFDHDCLQQFRHHIPEIWVGFLVEKHDPILFENICSHPKTAYHLSIKYNTLEEIANLAKQGIPTLVYTVNDPDVARQLQDVGVWAVFSDNPTLNVKPAYKYALTL